MFPWVYDFRWEPAHLIFLTAFGAVLLTLTSLLILTLTRTVRALRQGRAEAIRWAEDFHDLPGPSRACRHELTGEVARRTCARGFDCRTCEDHETFLSASPGPPPDAEGARETDILGFHMPADRLYHRGHTYVHPEPDGTVTVGLDDFASRLIGRPDKVLLPPPGSRLTVNGTAWRLRKGTAEVRVLSPVDGEVMEQGGDSCGWYLRVRPAQEPLDTRRLLRDGEIRSWILREVERLEGLLSRGPAGISLADGGAPIEDLASAIPEARRDEILGEMLLEP